MHKTKKISLAIVSSFTLVALSCSTLYFLKSNDGPSTLVSAYSDGSRITQASISCASSTGKDIKTSWTMSSAPSNTQKINASIINQTDHTRYTFAEYAYKGYYVWRGGNPNDTYQISVWYPLSDVKLENKVYTNSLNMQTCTKVSTPTPTPAPTLTTTPSPVVKPTGTPIATATPTPTPAQQTGMSFISRSGKTLMVNNKAWKFTGYNNYQLTADAQNPCGNVMSDTDVSSILDQIKSASKGSVIRTWFFRSYGNPSIGWASYDRIISLAKQRGIYIIPVLENQWSDCGKSPYKTLNWYQNGYTQANDGYNISYSDYVKAIVTRYANEPAIAFWQLMNEAEARDSQNGSCNEVAAATALKNFADTISGEIKSIDHNHLVNLGSMGSGQCGLSSNDYQTVQSGANIDILEYHDYNANNVAMPGDQYNGLSSRINQAAALNKPIFIGEAGIRSNVQSDGSESGNATSSTVNQRAADFQAKMTAQFNQGIAGYLIWVKSLTNSDMYGIYPGDPTEKVMSQFAS